MMSGTCVCFCHVCSFTDEASLLLSLSCEWSVSGLQCHFRTKHRVTRRPVARQRDYNNSSLTCTLGQTPHISWVPALWLSGKDAPLRFCQRHIPALRSGPDEKTAAYIRTVATQRERTGKRSTWDGRRDARRDRLQITSRHDSTRAPAYSDWGDLAASLLLSHGHGRNLCARHWQP